MLADATLHPLTTTGAFTIEHLHLNRPALVAYRRQSQLQSEDSKLLEQFQAVVSALERMQRQHTLLLQEHRGLLEELRA